jgi:acylglycerol lipase
MSVGIRRGPDVPVYSTGSLKSQDDVDLFFREWTPSEVDSVIVFLHGIGLHSGSGPYGDNIPVAKLMERGTAFYAPDMRGHGRSSGSIEGMTPETLVEDLDVHLEYLRARYVKPIIYLYGHNFGGMLALKYSSERSGIRGVIVSEYSRRINQKLAALRKRESLSSIFQRFTDRIYHRSRRFEFLTGDEYQGLCNRYRIPPDKGVIASLETSGGKEMSYGKEFFAACGVGKEREIGKNVSSSVLMIFTRNDAFFDLKGAYEVITDIASYDKELSLIEASSHYDIIKNGQDSLTKWMVSRLPRKVKV